jgi:probable rRNA maturation factor
MTALSTGRRVKRRPPAPMIDFLVESPRWKAHRGVKAALRRAVAEAASAVSTSPGEVAIVLSDDSRIRALNRVWRGKDEATNVLSFPAGEQNPDTPRHLGDLVIAYETTAREAKAEHKPFMHHLAHLAVHGFLHLVGYDHAQDTEAEAMEALEIAVLARVRVPNPYLARQARR